MIYYINLWEAVAPFQLLIVLNSVEIGPCASLVHQYVYHYVTILSHQYHCMYTHAMIVTFQQRRTSYVYSNVDEQTYPQGTSAHSSSSPSAPSAQSILRAVQSAVYPLSSSNSFNHLLLFLPHLTYLLIHSFPSRCVAATKANCKLQNKK